MLFGFNEADDYGATQPAADYSTWGNQIQNKVVKAVEANGCQGDAKQYAAEVRDLLTPDILRYRIGTRDSSPVAAATDATSSRTSPKRCSRWLCARR
ncbi:hypothetical protein [Streptomyces lycii]|uniref:Uncharacterized protein n=1 Tax=Streptomyces lycii TaxID=2654337 RepID=A0ABQ7FMS9_9ACTN|nr:hypothetical protein [Streptomyces lycii]KAF4408548.1 hypothetical protein GCU69_14065 [Streptomyces lycii]